MIFLKVDKLVLMDDPENPTIITFDDRNIGRYVPINTAINDTMTYGTTSAGSTYAYNILVDDLIYGTNPQGGYLNPLQGYFAVNQIGTEFGPRVPQIGDYIEFTNGSRITIEQVVVYSLTNSEDDKSYPYYQCYNYLSVNETNSSGVRKEVGLNSFYTGGLFTTGLSPNYVSKWVRETPIFTLKSQFLSQVNNLEDLINLYKNINVTNTLNLNSTQLRNLEPSNILVQPSLYGTYNQGNSTAFTPTEFDGWVYFNDFWQPISEEVFNKEFYYFPFRISTTSTSTGARNATVCDLFNVNHAWLTNQPWRNAEETRRICALFFEGIETTDDPGYDADNYGPDSEEGGGKGDFNNKGDNIGTPDLPTITALTSGFLKMYNPSIANLQSLGGILWSTDFITNIGKFFNDPSEGIISLQITYAEPVTSGSQNIKLGNYGTSITSPVINQQYVKLNCGTINVHEYFGSFLDYSPNTRLSIYLPFIGIRELNINEVMDGTIGIIYNIDLLTGTCVANITVKKGDLDSVLYSYSGNCNTQISYSASNHARQYEALLGVVGAGVGAIGTVATGGAALPALSGLASSGANAIMSSQNQIQRGGSVSTSAGALSVKTPYLILERPIQSKPKGYNEFDGFTTNITTKLSSCSGYTEVESIHLDGVSGTENEKNELYNLLKNGVII